MEGFEMKQLLLTAVVTAVTFVVPAFAGHPKSDDVRKVQQVLKDKGYYDGEVDGKMGPLTRAALQRYQTESKLTGDGRFTRETAEHMGVVAKGDQSVGDHFEKAGDAITSEYSGAGKSVAHGAKAAGSDLKDGEVGAGAVDLGKGVGKGAKKVATGTKDAAVAVGKGVADAFDGKNTEKEKSKTERSRTNP
jgi:peptidoglycan hydrolase-like protein with peptidoglycan-binding domain